jgi:hypothetical protein
VPAPRAPRPAHCVSPPGQLHRLFTHPPPPGQTVPHPPQLALFVEKSTQMDPRPTGQMLNPPSPHPATHAPPEQVVPRPHPMPHPPQLALSLCGFTHVAPHKRSPAAQLQALLAQVAPLGHCVPQPPQSSGFVVGSTHAPLQLVSPAPQTVVHTPAEHTGAPAGHTLPQLPQLFGSFWVWMHTLLQRIPFRHWHTPPWHAVPAAQRVLQVPQLALFVERSRHALPHWLAPPAQTHAPATHVSPGAQATPHPPQLFGSV